MGLGAKGFCKMRSIMDKLENELRKENAKKKVAAERAKDTRKTK